MAKTRIMILGAGVYQVPLVKKAKHMGLETLVVSPRGNYPAIPLADVYLDIDTTNEDHILDAARAYGISGIVTTGTDVCLPSLGKVADALKLPGPGYEAALSSMDKGIMKKALVENGVPTADFEIFTNYIEAKSYAAHLAWPVMVKAVDSSGSRGITKVSNENEFKPAWDRAFESSRSKRIIVEKFLSGIEFGAQAFIHGNQVMEVFPHGDVVTPPPFCTPFGHSMPAILTEDQKKRARMVIEKAVEALGIVNCVSNVDFMMVDGEPTIIEIGARMGATCLPENLFVYAGIDAYEHVIRLALGEHLDIEVTAQQANASLLLRAPETGILRDVLITESVRRHPGLVEIQIDVKPGDHVKKFQVGPDRIGHLVVKADSAMAATALAEELAAEIQIKVIGN